MKETVENLIQVIEVLRSVPDEQFNMEHWWLEDGIAFDEDRNVMYKVADGPCGCAVGHLIQRGLLPGSVLNLSDVPDRALPHTYKDRIYVQIADALKLWNYQIAELMFSAHAYPNWARRTITRQQVIRRIELVITELEEMK